MKKKKIVFHSNHCKSKTGFGRNAKAVLKYLYSTGKYDIVEYATGLGWNHDALKNLPWQCRGTLPESQQEWNNMQRDPGLARAVQYGAKYIDRIIKEERPDVYIGVEDIWAFNGYWNKKWWNKVNCVIHTTLDSEPILPLALEAAPKIKNYYVWAEFAKRGMHEAGFTHVDKLYGAFDTTDFFRLENSERMALRKRNGINPNAFIVGFVFRNQLRKSVPQLLDGFKTFLKNHPNAYLLLHTCWSEDPGNSWNIEKLVSDRGIDSAKVLTTYVCPKCGSYEVRPFKGENLDCRFCGAQKAMLTSRPQVGVSENQLNEIYNLMDVYCHPFTSGGQEMPIQEAKLTELITLVTNYSCGEEYCSQENGGLPLDWKPYYEVGTNFMKATTLPSSITSQLEKVYKMSHADRKRYGQKARTFVLDNFAIEVIGKQWEEIIDNLPEVTWDFDFTEQLRNPSYQPSNEPDNIKWLQELYRNILLVDLPPEDKGVQDWLAGLNNGAPRERILEEFRKVAISDNQKINRVEFTSLLDDKDEGKRIAIVMPESAGDVLMATALLPNIKAQYPEYNIYFITKSKFMEIVQGNPYVHRVIPYAEACENLLWMEGQGNHKGYFEIAFLPHIGTQRHLNYIHNGKDKIQFDLKG